MNLRRMITKAEDCEMIKQRYHTRYSIIEGHGGEKLLVKNGSGVQQGDIPSPDMFGQVSNPIVQAKDLIHVDPVSKEFINTETTG